MMYIVSSTQVLLARLLILQLRDRVLPAGLVLGRPHGPPDLGIHGVIVPSADT